MLCYVIMCSYVFYFYLQIFAYQGLGTKLMVAYVDHIRASQMNVEKMLLLSKQALVPFYTRCGFKCVGPADVTHGQLCKLLLEYSFYS